MKKLLLTTLIAAGSLGMMAQKVDKAKDLLGKNKIAEAKTEIDAVLADAKNQKTPDAWYWKGKVYAAISADNALSSQTPDAAAQAFEAFKKYVELDDKHIALTLENYKPIADMYQAWFKKGAAQYQENKFADAFGSFKNTLEISDYMSSKGWANVKLDTTVVLYTGISAEKANKRDDAAIYYARLADAKVNGENMSEIYKWLADYYAKKEDRTSSVKYLNLGKELYPKDSFWEEYEMQMIRDSGDKKALFDKYESMIAKDPSDYMTLYNYSVELYQTAYDTAISKRPANSEELINKVEANMKKVVELKPDYQNAYLVLGQIAFNKGVDLTAESKKIRPQGNIKLKPEELKKKDDLRNLANKRFDEAVPYFEKIDELLGSKGKLKMDEKKALKDAYDLLITIYDNRGNKDKVKVWEDKFNNVEKVH
ncbi:MAG: tetratricopeptide repeat protein [Bacteroidota bacterium]|nr:tetratricopeptide repeat protein [Bacteroidota bacterium]